MITTKSTFSDRFNSWIRLRISRIQQTVVDSCYETKDGRLTFSIRLFLLIYHSLFEFFEEPLWNTTIMILQIICVNVATTSTHSFIDSTMNMSANHDPRYSNSFLTYHTTRHVNGQVASGRSRSVRNTKTNDIVDQPNAFLSHL